MIALTSTSHRRPTAAWAISGVADRPSQPQLAVTASACLLGLVKVLAHHVSNLPDGLGIVAHHESRLAAGECTNACVDRFLAESCAVATGETVPSRVVVQMALCARYGVIRVELRAASRLPEGEISSAAFAP